MTSSDHEFGGVSTDLKLSLVEGYLHAFMTALRSRFRQLWYIDAFAGTGERTVKLRASGGDFFNPARPERIERHRGSARIAIEVEPKFDKLVFIEKEPAFCEALRELRSTYPERQIEVLEEDANQAIKRILRGRSWEATRAVMFLDPYGMSVDWKTLEEVRATEAIDVWYLVSLAGMFRQAARRGEAIDESKRAALIRMLGTDDWEDAWYQRRRTLDLFADTKVQRIRVASVDTMEKYMWDRLAKLFPKVLPPLRLKTDRGVSQFALFFAISNSNRTAINLAAKIAGHILNSGR